MKLMTAEQRKKLLANGAEQGALAGASRRPVVKLFYPCGAATWLLSELDPDEPSRAFGLCDLGHGEPELGYVDLDELAAFRWRMGLRIERDRWFTPNKSLAEYTDEARKVGRIVA